MMFHLFRRHLLLTSQIPVFLRCQFLAFFSFLYYNFSLGNTIFFLILIKTNISMIFKPLSSAQTFKPQNCLLWATKNPHPNALQTKSNSVWSRLSPQTCSSSTCPLHLVVSPSILSHSVISPPTPSGGVSHKVQFNLFSNSLLSFRYFPVISCHTIFRILLRSSPE